MNIGLGVEKMLNKLIVGVTAEDRNLPLLLQLPDL